MPKNDEISRGLSLSIKSLQSTLQSYETEKFSHEDTAKLLELQGSLSKCIEKISSIVNNNPSASGASSVGDAQHDTRPSFSRARFYTSDNPFLNRMDQSRSYRLVPPMKVRKSAASACQTKRVSPNEFLLNSLQLLENITNLQRLNRTTGGAARQ